MRTDPDTDPENPLVVLGLRVPAEHAAAVRKYAVQLAAQTRLRVTSSAAGAAILEAGLVALGLIASPSSAPVTIRDASKASKPAPKAPAKGGKKPARKP